MRNVPALLPAAFRFAFPEGPVHLRRSAAESPLPEKRKPVEIPSCCYALVDFTEGQKPRYVPAIPAKTTTWQSAIYLSDGILYRYQFDFTSGKLIAASPFGPKKEERA
ncbi:MAG TPA: hypothetical protein PK167_05165 [Prolixibacteraceae bacterium]|nr:hypothetical protein [Prolixibacteraceae bacterium]